MQSSVEKLPFNSYSDYLIKHYGYRIWRVGIDAGFSCPNRGCERTNGGCVYCDSQGAVASYQRFQESSYSRKSNFESEIDCKITDRTLSIHQQIEKGLEFLSRRYKAEHFALYLQSFSNTFAPLNELKSIYDYCLGTYDWDQFIVSTRPDCIDESKVALLASYVTDKREVCLELGLQSGDDNILRAMGRGHSVRQFTDAASVVKKYNLPLCVHILIGFPGEGPEELERTINVINEVHPQAIKIHNLNICAGTRLYDLYKEGKVNAPGPDECIEKTIDILRKIHPDIVIERLMCETPSHRLAAPRNFPDKNTYTSMLKKKMLSLGARQGDLFKESI